jgi:NhaA family Na+:H+ antiporter
MKKPILLEFFKSQAFSGILLLVCTVIALLLANSPLSANYHRLQHALQHPINDGLMAIFFLMVGLEIKRELVVGELNAWRKALLPAMAAVGGMVVPAVLYTLINWHHPQNLYGWAISSATDIAFALGVLSLLGKRVPRALFVFLAALAIIDDLGAIVIIAIFYNQSLVWANLLMSVFCWIMLLVFNGCGVKQVRWYLLVGVVLWYFMLHSGIHATIAGVLLALTIPAQGKEGERPPLYRLEQCLHLPVTYTIIPLFVLFNAGISFQGVDIKTSLLNSETVGVVVGLVIGKCVGIFGVTVLLVKGKWVKLSEGVQLRHYLPVSLIAGIGFTMSIFISELAFPGQATLLIDAKLGILGGSLLAAILGYLLLRAMIAKKK